MQNDSQSHQLFEVSNAIIREVASQFNLIQSNTASSIAQGDLTGLNRTQQVEESVNQKITSLKDSLDAQY